MWDQHVADYDYAKFARIIPTYVGSTDRGEGFVCCASNHSHVCGINLLKTSSCLGDAESFPRMWDQQRKSPKCVDIIRIIPTYVGSTLRSSPRCFQLPNHSHVCGINNDFLHVFSSFLESFPRMWDQQFSIALCTAVPRIIPTYVGSTGSGSSSMILFPNHSHVCGINQDKTAGLTLNLESFPRMWDQPGCLVRPDCGRRIIPTYVGSTPLFIHIVTDVPNHSHVCGINDLLRYLFTVWQRIIPTYVGSTIHLQMYRLRYPNHSHVCGINRRDQCAG